MMPPVESSVLAANPIFEALYRDLCTNKLQAEGGSKVDAKAQKEHNGLQKELRKARFEASRRDIVRSNLQHLAYRDDELPDDLRGLIALTAAALAGEIADEDRELVDGELERFAENISPIAEAMTRRLSEDAATLRRLLATGSPVATEEISGSIQQLKDDIAQSRSQLAQPRLSLAHEIQQLHNLYRQVLETCIRILEQTIHGSVARGTKAKADYLATVADGMSKKLSIQHAQLLQQVYSTDMQGVLKTRMEAVREEIATLRRKVREAEERLGEYRSARGMQGMVKEYAEILKESEKAREEIERLEKR